MIKPIIQFSDFEKVDLRVGFVTEASVVAGSDRLFKLTVDFGPQIGIKTIFTGLRGHTTIARLQGKKFIFVANLAPRKMPTGESQGMLLVVEHADTYVLVPAPKSAQPGEQLL